MRTFQDKVVYQIYSRSFQDSNGDGIGDLGGIIQRLDYLQALGVDYLWITPVFPSPQNDNGYDVSDYCSIDPVFGTMEDLETLIQEGKKRNIGLMLDMVFNHTSTQHPWFQRALAGDKKYQDFYIFHDGEENRPPTNWISKFGGPAWEYVPELKKWYLHLFDVTQADLNWDNPAVRQELKQVISFWKEKGIEGFRFDVVNLISKPKQWENDYEGDGRRFYTDGRRVHEFLKELVRDTGIGEMITVGEMSSTSLENCVRYSGPEEKELTMCFHFQHLKTDYKNGDKWELMETDRQQLKRLFQVWQEKMAEKGAWDALFWSNHDQPRIVSRMGSEGQYWKESAKMLAAAIHLMRGTPYIYQGEEIGMTNPHFRTIDQYRDVESLHYYEILKKNGKTEEEVLEILGARSRDNSRTPMQWTSGKNGGFSQAEPWIPMADHADRITVEAQEKEADSILGFYKKLIAVRKANPVIAEGSIAFMETENPDVLAYERCLGEGRILVWNNLTERKISLSVSREEMEKTENWKYLLGNYQDEGKWEKGELILRPYETLALEWREK